MLVYRLSKKEFAGSLSGKGAALRGARWNSAGTEIIYTAASRALAMAEVAVHISLKNLPDDYQVLTIYIPDDSSLLKISPGELLPGWNRFPPIKNTKIAGDNFIDSNDHLILQVPSAVVPGDYNFLLNPAHPEFDHVKIVEAIDFPFDKRMFG